ncbi:uncharacterized protein LOC131859042 [Cryptomeria japonica]|uniref:uncharacterized protein LOC131859042 n=1 Tax=Cryptomeria japonica TaxID=3369 RepID=UPI0027DAAE41|nr:uncharacterized protein LOC131859042 [Cryptomeria japonica]
MVHPYQKQQQIIPPPNNQLPQPTQPPKSTSMPTQPNPNPNNKATQPMYNNEVAGHPTYLINAVELEGVQLRLGKALQGPTITELNDEPEEDLEKEPPFPYRFLSKPIQKEAIKDIPVYSKIVRELCTMKQKKKEDPKTVQVIEQLADLILANLTILKYSNLGSLVIMVSIGKVTIPNTLVDLGAAINVMTNETKEKLSLGGLRPTPIVLQMENQSLVKPEGVIEDVILSIDSWDYPTDFMILQPKFKLGGYPLILGQPWLAVVNAFINFR